MCDPSPRNTPVRGVFGVGAVATLQGLRVCLLGGSPSLRIAAGCVCVPRERLPRRADGLWRCCLVFGVARDGVEDLGVPAAVKTGLFVAGDSEG